MPQNNAVVLKTYNEANIEQLDVCTAKLMHNDKVARCRFLVVPGDRPALFGMPDTEELDILKIMHEVVNGQQTDRKVDPQIMQPAGIINCKTHILQVRQHGH